MKKIFLIRHAKAVQSDFITDFDRPLNEKGISNAHLMGNVLLKQNIKPQLVISSPAIRALCTAIIICKEIKYPLSQIVMEPSLYDASVDDYIYLIKKTSDEFDTLFLFAHNPTITDVCNLFSENFIEDVPTTGVVGFTFNIETWRNLGKKKGALITFNSPPQK